MIGSLGTMSAQEPTAGKARAYAGRRNPSGSPAPNQADIANEGRLVNVSIRLPIDRWRALDNVAPNRMGSQLAALLIQRHAPRTRKAARELAWQRLAGVSSSIEHADTPSLVRTKPLLPLGRTLLLPTSLVRRFDGPSLSAVISAIVAEHIPRSPEEGLALWCAERAAILARDPAEMRAALCDEPAVAVKGRVPGALGRRVDLARYELSAAGPPALGPHLLSALIWAHADPADQNGLDTLMGHLVIYEGVAALAGADATLQFLVPVSLRDRLNAIAAAVYWRRLGPGSLVAALLWTHTETSFGDPATFERMLGTCEDYTAAARVGSGDASLP
jgi:hypothetical protein